MLSNSVKPVPPTFKKNVTLCCLSFEVYETRQTVQFKCLRPILEKYKRVTPISIINYSPVLITV